MPFLHSTKCDLLLLLLGSSLRSGSSALFVGHGLHRKLDAAAVIGLENLDADNLAFLDVVLDLVDALLGDLRDMQQTILARQNLNNGTEIKNLENGTFVDLADLDFRRDGIDAGTGSGSGITGGGSDGDRAVVLDVDGGVSFQFSS